VRRAALVVILALLAFNVSGLATACDEASCDESCPTDLPGGQCPPNCHNCSCCSLPRMAAAAGVALIHPPPHATPWVHATQDLASPEPAEILHIPKPVLA